MREGKFSVNVTTTPVGVSRGSNVNVNLHTFTFCSQAPRLAGSYSHFFTRLIRVIIRVDILKLYTVQSSYCTLIQTLKTRFYIQGRWRVSCTPCRFVVIANILMRCLKIPSYRGTIVEFSKINSYTFTLHSLIFPYLLDK